MLGWYLKTGLLPVIHSDIILRGKNLNPEGNLPSKAKSKLHVNKPFIKFRGENDLFFAWG
jgi:hypothetical protein